MKSSCLTIVALVAIAGLAGCDTTSKCEKVDREFQRVISQREVEVVDNAPTIEAHFQLDRVKRALVNELSPALVASLPDPPESGFELQIGDADLSPFEGCPICYRLTGTLTGEAAADGVDIDVDSGTIDLVFEVGKAQRGAVFIPARPARVSLGDAQRLRDEWRVVFENALVEQLDLIRPRPAVLRLPPSLDSLRTQILAQNDRLSLVFSKSGEAEPEHPEDPLWLNPRHVQRLVESLIELEPRVAAGTLVRAETTVAIPVRHFGKAPECRIDEAELVLDLENDEVVSRPSGIPEERARELLEALRLLEPDTLILRP